MTPTKPSANEKRLAKLLWEYADVADFRNGDDTVLAAFLARRGVLAVSAQTVPDGSVSHRDGILVLLPWELHPALRLSLRRLARGQR